ncbi:geranylgeranyl reductase family protein [Streptomyces minutiscleroticus]|uniref:geranylgeranyl reductase family protein n=1 Tax=Streptomyces minutiscleroticus TaxID=68238 RepID=UPI00332D29B6
MNARPRVRTPSASKTPAAAPPPGADDRDEAQVIVVGAGPGGSAAAFHLARHGVDVLLLEKSEFPREKVCGDGLTPRAVHQLVRMGVDTAAEGWSRNRGLRFVSNGRQLEVDWPETARFPGYGLTRTRHDFDDLLARRAAGAGARLRTLTKVTAPVCDRTGRVVGVRALAGTERREVTLTAPVVIAADGASARLALSLGLERRKDRPVGTAVRRYYRSPARHQDDYLESWLDLRRREDDRVLPGYGWIFPLGDGRVNVGLGVLNESRTGTGDTRRMMDDWLVRTPPEWGLREENADGPLRGAALPMGFNRVPHYLPGMMLIGDCGGMVNPCNGEGIPYAMEAGELAAEIAAQALVRPEGPRRERALAHYAQEINRRHGGYYRLGNAFSALMARPRFTSAVTQKAVKSPAVTRAMVRMLSNLTDDPAADATDLLMHVLVRAVSTAAPARHASARSNPRAVTR